MISGKYFRIIQFLEIPSDEDKQTLKNQGVDLIGYLPNYAYFASVQQGTDLKAANARGIIRAILPISPEYKIHPSLKNAAVPASAEIIAGKADLIFTYFKGISSGIILSELKSNVKEMEVLEQDDFAQWIKIRVKKESISALSLLSFAAYIEPVVPWVMENNSGSTLHRSNTINTSIFGGLQFDGTGVGVSEGDGGAYFGHVDIIGRNKGPASPGADHGTHVAGIIAGAGNINPRYKGMAPGANLQYSNGFANISSTSAITTLFNGVDKIRITSHSLGQGVNGGYDASARQNDLEVDALPSLFSVHSCGNSGSAFFTITGGYKAAKNSIAVGNLAYTDVIASSSSRGPSKDGRIKPDICAKGSSVQSTMPNNAYGGMSGTSMACPGVAGSFAQLIHAYRNLNANADPKLAQLKAIVLNTGEDLGNVGPDYTYGWGRINVWKAYNTIKDVRYFSSTVANGANKTHPITVPANVKELRVMAYWADPAAAAGVSKALINDLDITLSDGSQTYNPWLLNNASTSAAATKGQDRDNNMEQITVTAPPAGAYTLTVNGFQVPQGPQEYWVTYEFITDDIKVTYPIGAESFVPGETEYIRWDAYGTTGMFTIEYSSDGGTTWAVLSSAVAGTARYYTWAVPTITTGKALIRVSRAGKTSTSDANFNIIRVPTALTVSYRCSTTFQLSWTAATGATSYEVYLLGAKYMMSQGTTAATNFVVTAPNSAVTWASVRALADNGTTIGRRAIAIQVPTAVSACPPTFVNSHSGFTPYNVSVFPNPMNEQATISLNLSDEESISIQVLDICGKVVSTLAESEKLPAGEHQYTLDGLNTSGIYMVMIKGNKGSSMEKIVVTKN